MTVIYVDVLFVVNFFITFFLILITEKLCKREEKMIRLVSSSFIGGIYSLVILFDELNFLISNLGKLLVAFIIIGVAFKFRNFKTYLKEVAIFFFANLMFLGVIIGIWFIFKPKGIVINNALVYFDVSAKTLLISSFVAYVISVLAIKIYNNKLGKKELYLVEVFLNETKTKFFAFADSGNNLKEPFSDFSVIIADKNLFKDVTCNRIIPFNSIGGEGVLYAFKPDKVIISSSYGFCEVNNVYVALSDRVKRGEYEGIINPKILNIWGVLCLKK